MPAQTPDELNHHFGIDEHTSFHLGPGDFPFVSLTTSHGTAEVCLYGAHLTSWIPTGAAEVIWTSPDAIYRHGKAIRGGIPVCWPRFADQDTPYEIPAHGVARTSLWEVTSTSSDGNKAKITLRLPPCENLPAFDLQLAITVSEELHLELTTTNLSDQPFTITQALHTYLNVGDISQVEIAGLDEVRYHDKMDAYQEKVQTGNLTFDKAFDSIYECTSSDVLLHDKSLDRTIKITKAGSDTTVIWNPWKEAAEKMADMPDNGYQTMVCIEAANAGEEIITLNAGTSHTLTTTIASIP